MHLSKLLHPIFLAIALSFAGSIRSTAQDNDENNFTRYTKQDGLSHNTITGIAQDSIGYLWISTPSGLNRFNGSSFLQFHSNNSPLSLPEEYLKGLVWLDKHRLAAYTGGLHIVDTRTGETRNLFIPYPDKQYQYKFNPILSVKGDEEGDIFIVSRSGFYHFDRNYRLVYRFDYYSQAEVPTQTFAFGEDLLQLDDRRLIIIASMGIYYYDIPQRRFKKMSPGDCPLLGGFLDPKRKVQFFQQKPGRLFISDFNTDSLYYVRVKENKKIATRLPLHLSREVFDYHSKLFAVSDTLLYFTGKASGFYKLRVYPDSGKIVFDPNKYFPHYQCLQLLQDRDQTLWVGTGKGLFRQDNSLSNIQQVPIPAALEASFPNMVADDVYVMGDKLYVATRGDAGLLVFDKERLQFLRRIRFDDPRKTVNNVFAIMGIPDNRLLVATYGPLFLVNPETDDKKAVALDHWDKAGDWVADLYRDQEKNIWIITDSVYKYDVLTQKFSLIPGGKKPFDRLVDPSCIGGDSAGNIWIAGHGLLRYNMRTHVFDRRVDTLPYIKMPDREVNSFVGDNQNNLWINSNNNGLVCYNIEKGTFRSFTRDNGLPDNNIAAMIVLGDKLWMATFSGIACLDLQTYRITRFGAEDGFPDLPIHVGAKFFYDTAANKLYIGFNNSIVRFDPGIIYQKKRTPILFIENYCAGGLPKVLLPGSAITASWRDNEITVAIGSINFFTSNSQRYAYRLLKDDTSQWLQLGAQNTFSVSNLSPGTHRIQVKLYSLNNRWPDQVKEISITILPPFWKQNWFIALLVLFMSLSLYLLTIWRIGYIRKKEQAKTRIQALKAEEYKNQFELENISNYFSFSLAGKNNVEEVLWDVVKNLIGRMDYVDCIIYLWNEDKTKMMQKAAYGPKGTPKVIAETAFNVIPGQGVVGHVMLTKEPLLIPDTREDPRYRVDDMMRLSELCVPILHNDELIGIIDSEHHCANHYKERDLKMLTTIANLVGNKIRQIESEQSLEIKQKEIAFINQQLAEAQLSALQTQMNPHFIFNSLNSIKGMILANEQQKASRYLSKFANMIRITLAQSKEIFTTLLENIEYLESYLVMEMLRFDASFTFRITVDDAIDQEELFIPSLMIQPLAENAIWHGLMPSEGEKELSIRFSQLGESISCIIEDNGIGIKRSEYLKKFYRPTHQSMGVSNLRNRIKILNEKYDTGCTLEIADLEDSEEERTGTRVILRFKAILNKP